MALLQYQYETWKEMVKLQRDLKNTTDYQIGRLVSFSSGCLLSVQGQVQREAEWSLIERYQMVEFDMAKVLLIYFCSLFVELFLC